MRSPERHDVGDQAMRARELVVRLFRNPSIGLPAERLECMMDECGGVRFCETTLRFGEGDKFECTWVEDLPPVQPLPCDLSNSRVRDQIHPQQARKHPKRIHRQGFLRDGSERGRVYGQARGGEVVVVYGVHRHQSEEATEGV